jgi:hypothetical protein
MPTVKTKLTNGERRIITKVVNGERRVSCSCCAGCCMYPADELGSNYGADDLPDAVTVNWAGRFTGSMSKSGSGYASGGATLQVVNGIWRLSDSNGTRNVGQCLIRGDGNLTQGDDLVEDQFSDTYTVELDYENIGNAEAFVQENVVVTRVSLCRWEGLDSCGNLVELWYNSIDFAAEGQPVRLAEWNVQFYTNTTASEQGPIPCSADDSWFYKKEAPANTPTGTYHDSELGTVIVS